MLAHVGVLVLAQRPHRGANARLLQQLTRQLQLAQPFQRSLHSSDVFLLKIRWIKLGITIEKIINKYLL